jgi:hypothetical protein
MKYLSKEKIVELKRGTIEIVDKDKLQKIAM